MPHFLSVVDVPPDEFQRLIQRTVALNAGPPAKSLAGKCIGVYFKQTSTRTRTSFTVGAQRLGADIVVYGPQDLQTATGETEPDTAKVLALYLDALVLRDPARPSTLEIFASQEQLAIINAMNDVEHPTQSVADLATMYLHFGHLEGLRVLYVGEGNSTAASLALALSRVPGVHLHLAMPAGYGLPEPLPAVVARLARLHGARVTESTDVCSLRGTFDVVYTSRWLTTGTVRVDPDWHRAFEGFRVTAALFDRVNSGQTVFMHDLPAVRGEDVDACVLDGPMSLALRQASNKLPSAMAVLERCCGVAAASAPV